MNTSPETARPLLVPHGCALPEEDMTYSMPETAVEHDLGAPFVYLHGRLHGNTDLFFIAHGDVPAYDDADIRLLYVWDHPRRTRHEAMMLRWQAKDGRKVGLVVRLDDPHGLEDALEYMTTRQRPL